MLGSFSKILALGCFCAGVGFITGSSVAAAAVPGFPPVPDAVQKAGTLRVGTKCDYPPEGFLDSSGDPAGVEVAMAHQIAKYAFGDNAKAEIVCVTTANRVPSLIGGKVDLLIATLGITPDRTKVVDFTQPYAWASQGMIVRADSPYNKVADLDGKTVAFVKGALGIPYFEKNYPNIQKLQLDGVSNALQALMIKRAEGYAHDTPVLMSLTRENSKIRMLNQQFEFSLRAAAVRPGEKDLLTFVNASLDKMASDGLFRKWLGEYDTDDKDLSAKLIFWDMSKKPADK